MLMSNGVTFVEQGLCSGRVCLSVCLSHHLATALGLLLWAGGRRYRPIAARPVLGRNCWQCHAVNPRTKLNAAGA